MGCLQLSQEHAGELAVLFSGLAHLTRVRLVGLLLEEERNVSELMRALDLPQARVSRERDAAALWVLHGTAGGELDLLPGAPAGSDR